MIAKILKLSIYIVLSGVFCCFSDANESQKDGENAYNRYALEDFVPLSKSHLWKLMMSFYDHNGPQSWTSGGVPNFVTSNSYIATSYAKILQGFFSDCKLNAAAMKLDENEPLYIIELGAGQGKFSFLLLSALEEMERTLLFPSQKIVYVMTDFTNSNFEAWQKHPTLKPYFDSGRLDAAIFNAVDDSKIVLHKSGVVLSAGSLKNPVVVVANYLFDTLYHDYFQVFRGSLLEGLVSAGSETNEEADPLNPEIIGRMDNHFQYVPTQLGHYKSEEGDETHFQWMLTWYKDHYGGFGPEEEADASFLVPVGALRALRRLSAFSSKRALVITADKGNGNPNSFHGLVDPGLGLHGSFSMMVNYHAVALWTSSQKGFSLVDPHEHSDLLANVFLLGDTKAADDSSIEDCSDDNAECREGRLTKMNAKIAERKSSFSTNYPHLLEAYTDRILSFGPSDYDKVFSYHREVPDQQVDLITVVALLRLVYWDPDMFAAYSHFIADRIRSANPFLQADVAEGMGKIWKGFFLTEHNTDIISEIGRILVQMNRFSDAEVYYRHFLNLRPDSVIAMVNLGICLYHLEEVHAAVEQFEQALLIDPNYLLANEWLKMANTASKSEENGKEEGIASGNEL